MVTLVTWTHVSVTWYVHCLSCLIIRIIIILSFFSKVSELTLLFGNTGKVTWCCLSEKTEFWHYAWILHHDNVPAHDFCPKIGNRMWSSTIFGTVKLLAIPKTEDYFEEQRIFRHCQPSGMWQPSWRAFKSRDSRIPAIFLQVETPGH